MGDSGHELISPVPLSGPCRRSGCGSPAASYRLAPTVQQIPHHAAAGEWQLQMQRIDPAHQRQIGIADRTRFRTEGSHSRRKSSGVISIRTGPERMGTP